MTRTIFLSKLFVSSLVCTFCWWGFFEFYPFGQMPEYQDERGVGLWGMARGLLFYCYLALAVLGGLALDPCIKLFTSKSSDGSNEDMKAYQDAVVYAPYGVPFALSFLAGFVFICWGVHLAEREDWYLTFTLASIVTTIGGYYFLLILLNTLYRFVVPQWRIEEMHEGA